jgi:hypothetical protein
MSLRLRHVLIVIMCVLVSLTGCQTMPVAENDLARLNQGAAVSQRFQIGKGVDHGIEN